MGIGEAMRKAILAVTMLLAAAACTPTPASICGMPANAHFWQGTEVSWDGEVIEAYSGMHGNSAEFWDRTCARSIRIHNPVPLEREAVGFSGVRLAAAHIEGRIVFDDGRFWLDLRSFHKKSAWLSGDELREYTEAEIARLKRADPQGRLNITAF